MVFVLFKLANIIGLLVSVTDFRIKVLMGQGKVIMSDNWRIIRE